MSILLSFSESLHSAELLDECRLSPNAFRRRRTLTFPVLLAIMLSGFKAGVQNELNAFFAHLANQADLVRQVSAQAFSKARRQFSHRAFTRLNEHFLRLVTGEVTVPRWHGLRVVAADASKMRLFLSDACRRCTREVIAFALYLPGLEMTLASSLYAPDVGERQMLFEHLEALAPDDLLVLDRGYPARWLIAYLTQQGIRFCLRVDQTGFAAVDAFLRSDLPEQIVTIRAPNARDCTDYECQQTSTAVRLVKVATPNGRLYVLMTSMLDHAAYPAADFAALYHSRWRIEEAFKRLKHRLALENTSGVSWLSAQQDFAAKMLADNLHALSVLAADGLDTLEKGYKINRTYAFAHLKRCLPPWVLIALPSAEQLLTTLAELAKNVIAIKDGDSKPRPPHPKPHRKHAYKSTC